MGRGGRGGGAALSVRWMGVGIMRFDIANQLWTPVKREYLHGAPERGPKRVCACA